MVVVVVHLFPAQRVGNEFVVGADHEVVRSIFHVCDINPLAAQSCAVDVSTSRRNAHVATTVLVSPAIAALQIHHTESVLESDGDQSTIQVEQIVLGVSIVVPVAVAISPLELVVAVFAGHADVIIQVTDVFDVGREAHEFTVAVTIEAALVDVAIRFADLHDLGLEAVDDGLLHHHEVRTVARGVAGVDAGAVVQLCHGVVVAGFRVHASRGRTCKAKFPTPSFGARTFERGPTDPIRYACLEQDRQLRLVTATSLVVIKVDGAFVGVVKVAHLTVVVDVQPRITAVSARAEAVHAVGLRREGVPVRFSGGVDRAVVRFGQSHRVIAGFSRRARKQCAIRITIVATGGHDLAIEVHIVPPGIKNAVAVRIKNLELNARLVRRWETQRVCVDGFTFRVWPSAQHDVTAHDHFPRNFAGVTIGGDFHHEGAL